MPTLFARNLSTLKHQRDAVLRRRNALRQTLDTLNDEARKRAKDAPSLRWLALADSMGVSLYTIQHWAREGRVPYTAGKLLQEMFGKSLVEAGELDDVEPTL